MQLNKWLYCCTLFLLLVANFSDVSSQQQAFELPVQLVGFPFIVLSVRLTNFLKKLSYSVSPATYRARNRRQLTTDEAVEPYDVQEVGKYLVSEFGDKACIFESVCSHYAARAQAQPRPPLDWYHVFSQYKRSPEHVKEFYLLSVFFGDIISSPRLCHQLGKTMSCGDINLADP